MAIINVTYVVDNGSVNDVANEMSNVATVKFTEARIKSKEGCSSLVGANGLNRLSINLANDLGILLSMDLLKLTEPLTIDLDN
jgi:hypothetical protein